MQNKIFKMLLTQITLPNFLWKKFGRDLKSTNANKMFGQLHMQHNYNQNYISITLHISRSAQFLCPQGTSHLHFF